MREECLDPNSKRALFSIVAKSCELKCKSVGSWQRWAVAKQVEIFQFSFLQEKSDIFKSRVARIWWLARVARVHSENGKVASCSWRPANWLQSSEQAKSILICEAAMRLWTCEKVKNNNTACYSMTHLHVEAINEWKIKTKSSNETYRNLFIFCSRAQTHLMFKARQGNDAV